MENNRNREQAPEQKGQISPVAGRRQRPQGFEGMNFEEQRGCYKNSDGAGVNGRPSKNNSEPGMDPHR